MYTRKEMCVFADIKKLYPFFTDLEIINILKYYIERRDFHIDLGDELDIFEEYVCTATNLISDKKDGVILKHEGMNTIHNVSKEDAIKYLDYSEEHFQ